jgi:acyl-CoA thioester hydrolase
VARVAYLARFAGGYPALRAQGIESLVLESFVRYRRPALFDDSVRIHARVSELSGARFKFDYVLTRDDEVLADGWTSHACVDASSMRPVRVPEAFARSIATAEASSES